LYCIVSSYFSLFFVFYFSVFSAYVANKRLHKYYNASSTSRNAVPAEEYIMPFRHVINDPKKGCGTIWSMNSTQQTSSIVIHNNGRQKLSRFFDVISSSGTIYRLWSGCEKFFDNGCESLRHRRCHIGVIVKKSP